MLQRGRAGRRSGRHVRWRPRVPLQDLPGRDAAETDRVRPLLVGWWKSDLRVHRIDHGVDNRLLVGEVVVDRHRPDSQRGREPSDRERTHTDVVREEECALHNAVTVESRTFHGRRHADHLLTDSTKYDSLLS